MPDSSLRVPNDGLELAVETFGEGPWLVFAHGLTGNRYGTRRQFTPLADRYRIVIYDQRGHGDSTPVTDPALYDLDRMAGDMAAVPHNYMLGAFTYGWFAGANAAQLELEALAPARVYAVDYLLAGSGEGA